jgi:signal transduction histidine kinase/CheY-like chemotaxis protein
LAQTRESDPCPAPLPPDEAARLAALERYRVLDTEAEQAFDDLTSIASKVCGVPIALVSLVDRERQWFKSRVGLDAEEAPRDEAFCAHAILCPEDVFEVADAHDDPRFSQSPLVVGEPRARSYAGVPLVTPGGQAIGTLCVIDRRPRHLTKEQMAILRALGRQVVSQLELRRYVIELEVARSAAEAASRVKSEFLATMSHEIRTPMNGILGTASLLAETELVAPQRALVDVLQTSGESLLHLLNDILDFSKIEAGRLELEAVRFSLGSIVRDVASLFQAEAHRKGISLATSIDRDVPDAAMGDPVRLRQVLANLVGNAVKFTPRGEVSVDVSAATRDGALAMRFRVRDTGVGMKPEVLEQLFTPFTQADSSTTRKYGGTGLGLAICRRIVSLMGGEIGASSAPDAGTTMEFVVPWRALVDPQPASLRASSRAPSGLPSGRVLVVEDNEVNQQVILAMLSRLGCDADVASNGLAALAALEAGRYDVVLLDCRMPEMDGYEVATRVRAREAELGGRTPIIAMTASAFEEDRRRCLEIGMDDFLPKPARLAEVRKILTRWLGRPGPPSRRSVRASLDVGP